MDFIFCTFHLQGKYEGFGSSTSDNRGVADSIRGIFHNFKGIFCVNSTVEVVVLGQLGASEEKLINIKKQMALKKISKTENCMSKP